MAHVLEKIFGDPNLRELRKLTPLVAAINAEEPALEQVSDDELRSRLAAARDTVRSESDSVRRSQLQGTHLPVVFALVREAAKRRLGQRHYDEQLIGGIVLHQGKIAEMRTGEGKTLVATLPLVLNSLDGLGVHLVTPNDYLAKVGAHWMGPVYELLGLTVGVIGQQGASWTYSRDGSRMTKSESGEDNSQLTTHNSQDSDWPHLVPCTRQEAYACDITYGTNNEFGFDYLRDNMALSPAGLVQSRRPAGVGTPTGASEHGLHYAIVDEVDSILIDEARTPLIISAPDVDSADLYGKFATFVNNLHVGEDYTVDEKERFVAITDAGIKKMEEALGVANIYDDTTVQYVHHLEEALKAKALYQKDKDYVVKDGEVIIVDEFTGRLMHGRRYSEGLHQAIEAKEGVTVRQESKTLATITFQNLFRMYDKIGGMTGTAETEEEEFGKIYGLHVIVIPTHRPVVRADRDDIIYKTEAAKLTAVVHEIKRLAEAGQPILVGTVSIEKSERLSKLLRRAGVAHDVLNAKQHEREAKIIEDAGEPGRVTVATNMAGRGVDIVLGGRKPEPEASKDEFSAWEARHQQVLAAGGLAVIGTERHEARRIDNQLRGRSGRQGDPGLSQFYVSMDDDLMRIFGGQRLQAMMNRLGLPDDEPIRHRLISGSIEQAQKRVEGHNFDIRKHLVQYDDVMNQHREVVYRKRRAILLMDPVKEDWLHREVEELLHEDELTSFQAKVSEVGSDAFCKVERLVYLRTIDARWVEHLGTMQHLREGIGLRGYAQKDPLVEYKDAAYGLFQRLKDDIENQVVEMLLKLKVQATVPEQVQPAPQPALQLQGADERLAGGGFGFRDQRSEIRDQDKASVLTSSPVAKVTQQLAQLKTPTHNSQLTTPRSSGVTVTVRGPGAAVATPTQPVTSPYGKVGRNDPCPCGSDKKFKRCHGA